jgi:hypothetical protein
MILGADGEEGANRDYQILLWNSGGCQEKEIPCDKSSFMAFFYGVAIPDP